MGERITDKEFFNEDAETLAKKLLGKVISYNDIDYMITVTEAYPADDPYSYVNRDKSGFGHKCLTDTEKNAAGNFFINGNGIHIVGKLDDTLKKYHHVLIRGGIRVSETNQLIIEEPKMNFAVGMPNKLWENKRRLGIPKELKTDSLIKSSKLCLINSPEVKKTLQGKRIGIKHNAENDPNKEYINMPIRFYFIPCDNYVKEDTIE